MSQCLYIIYFNLEDSLKSIAKTVHLGREHSHYSELMTLTSKTTSKREMECSKYKISDSLCVIFLVEILSDLIVKLFYFDMTFATTFTGFSLKIYIQLI